MKNEKLKTKSEELMNLSQNNLIFFEYRSVGGRMG